MKKQILFLSLLSFILLSMPSCAVVGGIFKAGMVWGIILVVAVVIGIIALISRAGRK